jgi:Ulp1 family protease
MEEKQIEYIDTKGNHTSVPQFYLKLIHQFLKDLLIEKNKAYIQWTEKDSTHTRNHSTPIQRNGYDCGPFICWIIDNLSMNRPLCEIKECFMPLYRKHMAITISKKTVTTHDPLLPARVTPPPP